MILFRQGNRPWNGKFWTADVIEAYGINWGVSVFFGIDFSESEAGNAQGFRISSASSVVHS